MLLAWVLVIDVYCDNNISLIVYTNIMDICDASLVRQLYICGAAVMQLQDNRKTLG